MDTFVSLAGGRSLVMNLSKNYQVSEAKIIDQKEKNVLDKIYFPEIEKFICKTLEDGQNFLKKRAVSDVFITGEFLNLPNFYETTKKFFPNQKASFGDPRIGISIASEKFLPLDKKDGFIPYSIYFTQAFGMALKGLNPKAPDGINLLPDKLRESFSTKKMSVVMGLTSVLLALVSLASATFVTMKNQELNYRRIAVEGERQSFQQLIFGTRYKEIKKSINSFNNEVLTLNSIQSSLFSVPSLLDNISDTIPKGVKISSLNFNDTDLFIEISGVAENRDILLETQTRFEEADYVKELIAPRSNFDEKFNISFFLKLKLNFNELEEYGTSAQ